MRAEPREKFTVRFEPRFSERQRLSLLYKNISSNLDAVCLVVSSCKHPSGRALAVVLEEDLSNLCQECEEYLIAGFTETQKELLSLEARTFTVLDEVQFLMNQDDTKDVLSEHFSCLSYSGTEKFFA